MNNLIIFLAIFMWVGYTLIKASIFDFHTRKIPIKTWNIAVYLILPLSILVTGTKIWNGYIDINNPLQRVYLSISVIFLIIIGLLSWYSGKYKNIGIGGADFIAISTIVLTSIAIDIYLPFVFILFFIASSCAYIIYSCYKEKGYKIPMLIPISFAYFLSIGFYILNGFNAFFLI